MDFVKLVKKHLIGDVYWLILTLKAVLLCACLYLLDGETIRSSTRQPKRTLAFTNLLKCLHRSRQGTRI